MIRTRERVVLDDASAGDLYSEDEYVLQKRPRSVLCLPIVKPTYFQRVGERGWEFQRVPSSRKDILSNSSWGWIGVGKGGAAIPTLGSNRSLNSEPLYFEGMCPESRLFVHVESPPLEISEH